MSCQECIFNRDDGLTLRTSGKCECPYSKKF